MIRFALVVMIAGCFSRPELTSRDGGGSGSDGGSGDGGACGSPSGGLVLEENATHQVIVRFANGYSITFADPGTRYPMPIAINVGQEQLLANAGGCTREDQVGVAVFPIYSIAGNQTPTQPNVHPLDEVVVGPANIQLVSNWTYEHATACGAGPAIHGNGRTTWSMFPDGRVVRYDYLQPAENGPVMTDNTCSCVSDTTNFTITSYMAIRQTMVAALTATGAGEEATPLPLMNDDIEDARGACFRTPAQARVAMRWDDSGPSIHDSRIRLFGGEIAFVNDLVPGGGPRADAELTPTDTYLLRTHLFFERELAQTCAALNNKLAAHASSPPVLIDGAETAVDGLGFYDDTINGRTHTAAATFHADNGRIEQGFSLRIKFPGFRSITTSIPSQWQHEIDDTFYIFFPDGLANDEMITISPECAL